MRPKLLPAFGHRVTSQNPEGGASRSSRDDFPLMRTKLFKNPTVLCLNEERARHLMSGSRLPCVFFDDRSCVLVLSYSRKLRMTQMVELRFILYPFVAWATKSQDEGCFLSGLPARRTPPFQWYSLTNLVL